MEKSKKQNENNFVKKELNHAVVEVKDTVASSTAFVISSLTFVAGLAWNDFAKAMFSKLSDHLQGWGEILGLFLYAMMVTIIAVIVIRRLQKLKEKIGGKSIK